ncbi:hypothetical protein D9M71_776080 [compost metagenome]
MHGTLAIAALPVADHHMVPLIHRPIGAEQLLRPLATAGNEKLEQLGRREG